MTPEELARAYVETIHSPQNGHGQHVHPTLGRSDFVMLRLFRMVGEHEGNRLIDMAFTEARKDS